MLNKSTQILALVGFGLLGTIGGVFLESVKVLQAPLGLVVGVAAMGIGYAIMHRWGQI